MSELVWIVLEKLKLPKLVVLLLALAIVAFPRTADPIISDMIQARAAQITTLLDRMIPGQLGHVGRSPAVQQPHAAQRRARG
jgi:hypothetical protein